MKVKVYTISLNPPRWVRNVIVYVALPVGALLGAAAVVRAGVNLLPPFVAGTPIKSAEVNANFKALGDAVTTLQSAGYCGVTSAPHAGDLSVQKGGINGYVAAATICRSEAGTACAKTHLCTASEVSIAAQNGVSVPSGWFSSLVYGYAGGGPVVNDCSSWATSGTGSQASYWTGQGLGIASCNNPSLPLLCCL